MRVIGGWPGGWKKDKSGHLLPLAVVQVTSEAPILFSMLPAPWQTFLRGVRSPWAASLCCCFLLEALTAFPGPLQPQAAVAPCFGTDQALWPYAVRLFSSPNALIPILNPSYKLSNLGSNILPGPWPTQCLTRVGHTHFWCLMPRNRKFWLKVIRLFSWRGIPFFSVNLYTCINLKAIFIQVNFSISIGDQYTSISVLIL